MVATSLGSVLIEKHFIADRNLGGVDSHFSLDPLEFREMTNAVAQAHTALGGVKTQALNAEKACKNYRRSIYAVRDIAEGELIDAQSVRVIRPGFGLPPSALDQVVGSRANVFVPRGTALKWPMIT